MRKCSCSARSYWWVSVTIACFVGGPAIALGATLDEVRHVVSEKLRDVENRYTIATYWCYHEIKDESGTLSETKEIQYARTSGPSFVRRSTFLDGSTYQFGELTSVPEQMAGELLILSLRNASYDATIRKSSEKYLVTELRERQQLESQRDSSTLYAYGMPWFRMTFQEIMELPAFELKGWKEQGREWHLSFALAAPMSPDDVSGSLDNYSIDAVFDAGYGHCLSTVMSSTAGGYTTESVRAYVSENSEPFLREVTRIGRSRSSQHAVIERFLFREDDLVPPLTEQECKLSYYGLPEPSVRPDSGQVLRWAVLALFVVLGAVGVGRALPSIRTWGKSRRGLK